MLIGAKKIPGQMEPDALRGARPDLCEGTGQPLSPFAPEARTLV